MSAALAFQPPAVPAALRQLRGWVIWRYEQAPEDKKPRKMPYYPAGGIRWGGHGTERDRRRLGGFEDACKACATRGFEGVGLALLPEWGITALDFDDCVRDGVVLPEVLDLVEGTYAELSPSGRGVRAFVVGQVGNRSSKKTPERAFGCETFSSKGFVTVTGHALPLVGMLGLEDTVAPISQRVTDFCIERFGRAEPSEAGTGSAEPLGLTEQQLRDALAVLPTDLDYDQWLRVGMALHHETRGERFDLWDDWSATSAKYSTSEYGQARWDSFGRGDQRPTTAHFLVNLANEHGAGIETAALAADDFDVVPAAADPFTAAQPEPAAEKPNRFAVVPDTEFMQRPAPSWIVKGVVPQAELLVLFGESGAGKSFIALDLFGAVARGVPWRGLRTRQCRVVYIAAEGAGGFRNRLVAYAQHHGAAPGIGVIHAAPNLLQRDDALDVCRSIQAAGGADVVVVDTFAQATPGANENAAEDMGKALSHCKGIHRALGALVVLVHHAGKDTSRGARGWSGLKAAADAEIEVQRLPAGRLIRTSKQKDGEDGLQWGFDLSATPIGMDADGDVVTSCVVVETAVPAIQSTRAGRKLGKWEQHVVDAINEMAVAQNSGIETSAVIDLAIEREPKPEHGRDTRRQHASRALKRLCDEADSPYFLEDDGTLSVG